MPSELNKRTILKLLDCGSLVVAAALLAIVYLNSTLRTEVSFVAGISSESANDDIVEIISNTLPNEIEALIKEAERIQPDDWSSFQNKSMSVDFDQEIRLFTFNTRILKIMSYSPAGLTVYSSDPKQLGANYSKRSDIISALRDAPTGDIMQDNFARSFAHRIVNALIIESYRGIKNSSGSINGVAEVYAGRAEGYKHITAALRGRSVGLEMYLSLLTFLLMAFIIDLVLARPTEND